MNGKIEIAYKAKSAKQFAEFVERFGHIAFFVRGKPYGIEGTSVYEDTEADDFREEEFDSVESALDGFMINGKPLRDFVCGIEVVPMLPM